MNTKKLATQIVDDLIKYNAKTFAVLTGPHRWNEYLQPYGYRIPTSSSFGSGLDQKTLDALDKLYALEAVPANRAEAITHMTNSLEGMMQAGVVLKEDRDQGVVTRELMSAYVKSRRSPSVSAIMAEDNKLRMTEPDKKGRHPRYKHLIYIDAEPHHGSYIVTTPAKPNKSMLVSDDELQSMLDTQYVRDDDNFGYISDEYLDMFESKQLDEEKPSNVTTQPNLPVWKALDVHQAKIEQYQDKIKDIEAELQAQYELSDFKHVAHFEKTIDKLLDQLDKLDRDIYHEKQIMRGLQEAAYKLGHDKVDRQAIKSIERNPRDTQQVIAGVMSQMDENISVQKLLERKATAVEASKYAKDLEDPRFVDENVKRMAKKSVAQLRKDQKTVDAQITKLMREIDPRNPDSEKNDQMVRLQNRQRLLTMAISYKEFGEY